MNIQQKKKILHDYILLKLEENDLHGISDAANDLRVIEAFEAGKNENTNAECAHDFHLIYQPDKSKAVECTKCFNTYYISSIFKI